MNQSITFQADPSNHILFLDDDSDVRLATSKILERAGYRVDVAKDGEAGWEVLESTGYDLLITDHMMPRLSGLDLVKKLRLAQMELPVIIISAAFLAEALDENPSLRIAAVLTKPFLADELLDAVKAVLGETSNRLPNKAPH